LTTDNYFDIVSLSVLIVLNELLFLITEACMQKFSNNNEDGLYEPKDPWWRPSVVFWLITIPSVAAICLFFFSLVPAPGTTVAQDRAKYRADVEAVVQENSRPVAHAIFHLALPYLSEEQLDAFQGELDRRWGEKGNQADQYHTIASDIAMAALPGLGDNFDDRQTIILELYKAYIDVANFKELDENSWDKILLRQRYDQFQDDRKKLRATLVKYSELYPPTRE
jgi:hypothetical protein